VGDKRYELSNYLGNVLSVVSDRKLFQNTLSFTTFAPDVLSYSDYYPFGMLVPNRHKAGDDYRYGFQGQEKDDEIRGGEGNSLNYTFRMHDPRVGRFFAVDPLIKDYPHYTPYSFGGNKVIASVELEGLEDVWVADGGSTVKKLGPYVGAYTSEQAANNRYLEALAAKPKVARPQAEIRSNNLEDQVNKFRGVNPGLAVSRGIIDGAQAAPEVILPEIAFAKAIKIYKAFKQTRLALKAAKAINKVDNAAYHGMEFLDNGVQLVKSPVEISTIKPSYTMNPEEFFTRGSIQKAIGKVKGVYKFIMEDGTSIYIGKGGGADGLAQRVKVSYNEVVNGTKTASPKAGPNAVLEKVEFYEFNPSKF
jgi:RHS repeat-associated protein